MSLVITSLNSVSADQIGTIISFGQVIPNGSPTGSISIDGSLDGVNFTSMVSTNFSTASQFLSPSLDHYVLYARAVLSNFSGSAGDNVTVMIAGK